MSSCCTTGSLASSPLSAEIHGCGPGDQIRLYSGDDLKLTVTIRDALQSLVDLSGATVFFQVRQDEDSPVLITKTSAIPTEITTLPQVDPTTGQFELFLLPGDTIAFPSSSYVYGITIQFPDGTVRTAVQGAFVVTKRVVDLAAPPVVSGTPAPQTEAERNFLFTLPLTSNSFTVPIPGVMIDTTYTVMASFFGVPAAVGILVFANLQVNQFDVAVAGGGSLLAGTQIMFHVRDR